MKIHPDLTVAEIINDFSKTFPGLKIELYSKAHGEGENSAPEAELDHAKKLSEINPDISSAEMYLDPEMTVADFENTFKDVFSLNVQVFRKSNQLWLQTSATDSWTLETQNRKGLHSVQE